MALFLLQPGIQPLGQFDLLDSDASSLLGGEVAVLDEVSRSNTSDEKAAQDVLDGYVADGSSVATRTVARIADGYSDSFLDATKGNSKVEPRKVFYLTDDGTTHYGTLYGQVTGSTAGLTTTGGAQLGPVTTAGSGKVTLWDKPGTYAVSTDAVSDGLGDLTDTPLPGELLFREHDTGKLTHQFTTEDKVALFVEMSDNGSLVNTPARLVGATETFDRVKIQYLGATHNA